MSILRWFKYVPIATCFILIFLSFLVGFALLTLVLIDIDLWWLFPVPLLGMMFVYEKMFFLVGSSGGNEVHGTPKYPIGITHFIASLILIILLINAAIEAELFSALS